MVHKYSFIYKKDDKLSFLKILIKLNEVNLDERMLDLNENKIQFEYDKVLLVASVPQIIASIAMIILYNKNPMPANVAEVERVSNKTDGKPVKILTKTFKYYWLLMKNNNYWSMALSWGSIQGINVAFLITVPGLISQDSNIFKLFATYIDRVYRIDSLRVHPRLNMITDDINMTIGYLMLSFFTSGFIGAICAGILVDKLKRFKIIALGFICLCKSFYIFYNHFLKL